MKGFFNRILRINLKTRTSKEEPIPDSVCERTLGGKGLAIDLLMRENPPRGGSPLASKQIDLCPRTDHGQSNLWFVSARRVHQIAPHRDLLRILFKLI